MHFPVPPPPTALLGGRGREGWIVPTNQPTSPLPPPTLPRRAGTCAGYFVPFDLLDTWSGQFLSRARLEALLSAHSRLRPAPLLHRGPVASPAELRRYLDQPSAFRADAGPLEGVYLRVDEEATGWLRHRAKLVRPDFIQAIEQGSHWSTRMPKKNGVRFTG